MFWIVSVYAIVITLAFVSLVAWVVYTRGDSSSVFPCATEKAWRSLVHALEQYAHVSPVFSRHTEFVHRAIMSNGTTLSYSAHQSNVRHDEPVEYEVVANNPKVTARALAGVLMNNECTATIKYNTGPLDPPRSSVVLRSDAFIGWVMVIHKPFGTKASNLRRWKWKHNQDRPI